MELLEREGGGLTERTLEIICGGMDIPVTVGDGGGGGPAVRAEKIPSDADAL